MENPKTKSVDPPGFYSAIAMQACVNINQDRMYGLPQAFYEVDNYYANNDDLGGQNFNQVNLSLYYLKVKDTINAINAAKKSLILSKSYKNPLDILACLNQLVKVDRKNASIYAEEYIRVNDSMQIAERNFRDKFARIEFETDEITQQKNSAIKQKWIISITSGIFILVIILILIITKQRFKQKELRILQEQQIANEEIYNLMLSQKNAEDIARQQEKQRIAIELHDGVMNRLASTRFNLNILSYKKDEETISKCLDSVNELCDIEQEIRHIAHDLNLETFNNDSFTSLLTDLVATQNNITNTTYRLEIDEYINWIDMHPSIKMNLYRIIQEASHNINKSAQADNAVISFILDEGYLCLSVTDDGKGFDVKKKSGGIGLKNIKLRVNNMGGKFVIQSNDKSTSLNISIPLPN
ncbi:MAG: histidine kinase [Flavobacterium sp. JAD_PAG50586_2]|nr:MAG: histidine kinase [Flavobacterium sp. JAD_PAG50586_2]